MADVLNPQQQLFLSHYTDPKSETFGNALQSALRAGYAQEYAESITSKDLTWLAENVGDAKRIAKAEENLDSLLSSDKEPIKLDTTKFVLERLRKGKYAQRNEVTGKDGSALEIQQLKTLSDEDLIKAATQA